MAFTLPPDWVTDPATLHILGAVVAVSLVGPVVARLLRRTPSVKFQVALPEEASPGWKGGELLKNPSIQDPARPGQIICYDPSTGRHLATIRAHTKADVDEALIKARKAQAKWAKTTFAQRKVVLQSLLDFILQNQESICRVAARDTGKTMVDGKFGEILTTCERIRWTLAYGEDALKDEYRDPGLLMFYKSAKVEYRPMGVVAALVSWNYPFHNTFGPLITALFAGNGILIKASEQNCGQNCIGLERIIVHESLHDKLVEMTSSRIKQLKQGPPLEVENIDCGSMTMSGRSDALEALVQDAVKSGATLVHGGERFIHPQFPHGQFFTPTLITNLKPTMKIAQEEAFAPIMAIFKFSTVDEAIALANSTPYSLGSNVFSRNQKEGRYIMDHLRVGMSNLNDFGVNYLCQSLPFGGVGISGYGRFGGPEGLRAVCHQRSITVDRWPMLIQTFLPPVLQYPMTNVGDAIVVTRDLVNIIYAGWVGRVKSVFEIVKVLVVGANEPEVL
ncbi:Meiotic Sister-Chromatid recombination aldehyde dehydrogenase [Podila horticola]|nr:Meiotic Sister-Chromatid recombination aldehyde dehydrogenase [Podila horticola]